jgi:chromosome segregation ATPase
LPPTGEGHGGETVNEKELSKLYSELSIKNDRLTRTEASLNSLKAENDLLARDLRALKTKMQYSSEEAEARSRNVQQILDEVLALQIQLNLSEQKITKLEEENRVLIDRWMTKVAGEADQMNEALKR